MSLHPVLARAGPDWRVSGAGPRAASKAGSERARPPVLCCSHGCEAAGRDPAGLQGHFQDGHGEQPTPHLVSL